MLLFLLFLVLRATQGEYEECDTKIELQMNGRQEIRSKNFPSSDPAGTACRWFVHSPENTRVYVSCPTLKQKTCNGLFTVQRLQQPKVYCNDNMFYEFSTENWMILTYNVAKNSSTSGSSFICYFNVQNISYANACNSCGMRNNVSTTGGQNTSVQEYPMVAAIVTMINLQRSCGATIISPKYSLTAATCVFGKGPPEIGLVVGEQNPYKVNQIYDDIIKIYGIIIHPDYEKPAFDVALVSIKTPLVYTQNIGPACLPEPKDLFRNRLVTYFGWETTGGEVKQPLRSMSGIVLENFGCDGNPKSHFCYTSREPALCKGDLGGPFLIVDYLRGRTSMKIKIVGITDTEEGCSDEEMKPTLHTRVSMFVDWIKEKAEGEMFCAE